MRGFLALVLLLAIGGVATADGPASDEDSAKVAEVLNGWGCEGGDVEKESTGVFEVDDATCAQGEHDFSIDQDFSVFAIVKR